MNQDTSSTTPVHPSPPPALQALPHILVAHITLYVLTGGVAVMTNGQNPANLKALILNLRHQLLQHKFFDSNHRPEELDPAVRLGNIEFMDLLVLLARLYRVLVKDAERMRQGLELSEGESEERRAVRNEVLCQPFFDRARVVEQGTRLFTDTAAVEDEGCFA